jgi:large subunit ribosomal protein L18
MTNNLMINKQNKQRRKMKIRSKIVGTSTRPRLTVFISNLHVSAQIIDDSKQATLVSVTTVGQKNTGNNLTDKATWVGTQIAKLAKSKKIQQVVFDRNGKIYHGRVAALAQAARQEGLEF